MSTTGYDPRLVAAISKVVGSDEKALEVLEAIEGDGWELVNEARDFAEAFVHADPETQAMIREEMNRPSPLLDLFTRRLTDAE